MCIIIILSNVCNGYVSMCMCICGIDTHTGAYHANNIIINIFSPTVCNYIAQCWWCQLFTRSCPPTLGYQGVVCTTTLCGVWERDCSNSCPEGGCNIYTVPAIASGVVDARAGEREVTGIICCNTLGRGHVYTLGSQGQLQVKH